jgi:hypothetical protein
MRFAPPQGEQKSSQGVLLAMAFVEWSVYAAKLRQCADRMSGAGTAAEVRSSIVENARLWAQLEGVLSERLEKKSADWQTLYSRARYVAEIATYLPRVADSHVQTCVAINQQSAEMMPLLELSTTDFKLIRN